jgi:hypothetical protein
MDLSPYQLPLAPVPPDVEDAIGRGAQRGPVPVASDAAAFLGARLEIGHAVTRADDGRLFITTTTELPGVTPGMIDWWFGWHLPYSERYRLWHPTAHVRAVVKEDRSALVGRRECYLNNTSFVDEYIGSTLMKLAITFLPIGGFGFTDRTDGSETVICGRTADRSKHADAGLLVHRVAATAGGARMLSLFWLGEITPKVPVVGRLAAGLVNTPFLRRLLVPDSLGLALLRHCSEEMNHLAKFLPRLYGDAHA